MRTFAQKPKAPQQATAAKTTMPRRVNIGQSHKVSSILHLQRTIGNQATQRMLQTHSEEPNAGLIDIASPHFGRNLSRSSVNPPTAGAIQTKHVSNKAGDEYEQEADRVAEQVMCMPETQTHRVCVCGGGCPQCQTEQLGHELEQLQTRRVQSSNCEQSPIPPVVHDVLGSPGQPIDRATRTFMEPRFGYDLSQVRVHSDPRAARSARAMNAIAYTMGRDVVFDSGQYQTDSLEGRKLIAHELTHVVQQGFATQAIQRKPKKKHATTSAKLVYDEIKKRNPDLAKLITSGSIDFQKPKKPPAIKGGPMKNGEEHIWRVNVSASQAFPNSQIAKGQEKRTKVKGGVKVTHFIEIRWALPFATNPEFLKQTSSVNRAFTLTAAEPLYHELLHARIMMERASNWTNVHTRVFQDFTKLMKIANSPAVSKERQKSKQIIGQIAARGGAQGKAIKLEQNKYYEFLVHEKYDADVAGKAFGRHYSNALIAKNYSKVVVRSLSGHDRSLQDMLNRMLSAAVERLFDKLDQAANTSTSSTQTSSPPSTKQP